MIKFARKDDRSDMSDDQLRAAAPSVFSGAAMADVSARYAFVPTSAVVSALRAEGWVTMAAKEQPVKMDERRGFQKHVLNFQHRDAMNDARAGGYVPELVLVNSHDRSSAFQLHAGLYRLVCANGMVVADSTFEKVSVRHTGFAPAEVVEASMKLISNIPAIVAKVEAFKRRILSSAEMNQLAIAAAHLRFGTDLPDWPIRAAILLEPRRRDDIGSDLWTVFNRIQENVIKGGVQDRSIRKPDGKRFPKTRAVASLDRNLQINKELWSAAQAFAE